MNSFEPSSLNQILAVIKISVNQQILQEGFKDLFSKADAIGCLEGIGKKSRIDCSLRQATMSGFDMCQRGMEVSIAERTCQVFEEIDIHLGLPQDVGQGAIRSTGEVL